MCDVRVIATYTEVQLQHRVQQHRVQHWLCLSTTAWSRLLLLLLSFTAGQTSNEGLRIHRSYTPTLCNAVVGDGVP